MANSNLVSLPEAAELLARGEVVAIPTETVYGLAADATNASAVARVFERKNRPHFNPLIVHVATLDAAARLASFSPMAFSLAEQFWPGPLTLVLPRKDPIPDLVCAGLPTVGLRIPRHPLTQELLTHCGRPLAAPSANRFGALSCTSVEAVSACLKDVKILDGGPCSVGVESTIIGFINERPCLLRHGGIPKEEIERVTGPLEQPDSPDKPLAPGMLKKHYSPQTRLVISEKPAGGPRVGLLTLSEIPQMESFAHVEVLSRTGNLTEAATRLFSALRRLDAAGLDVIYAVPVPESGLGRAINDRLRRASAI